MDEINFKESIDEAGAPKLTATSPKLAKPIVISKIPGNYPFFKISYESGKNPEDFDSKYTRLDLARKAVELYVGKLSKSATVVRNEKADKRDLEKTAA